MVFIYVDDLDNNRIMCVILSPYRSTHVFIKHYGQHGGHQFSLKPSPAMTKPTLFRHFETSPRTIQPLKRGVFSNAFMHWHEKPISFREANTNIFDWFLPELWFRMLHMFRFCIQIAVHNFIQMLLKNHWNSEMFRLEDIKIEECCCWKTLWPQKGLSGKVAGTCCRERLSKKTFLVYIWSGSIEANN